MDEQKKRNLLLAVVAALLVIGGGIAFYFHQADSRYQATCEEAVAVLTDVRDLTKEVGTMPPDPASDDVQDYIQRLGKAQDNLGTLSEKFRALRVSGKHEAKTKALIDAIELERNVLESASRVLMGPIQSIDKTPAVHIQDVHDGIVKIDDYAAQLDDGSVDFVSAMRLDGLDEALKSYVQNVKDAAKKRQQEEAKTKRLASLANDPNLLFAAKDDAGRSYYVMAETIRHLKGGTFSVSTKEVTADGKERVLDWDFSFDEGQCWGGCKTDSSLSPSNHQTKSSPVATAIIRKAWEYKYQKPAPYLN